MSNLNAPIPAIIPIKTLPVNHPGNASLNAQSLKQVLSNDAKHGHLARMFQSK